MDSSVDVNSYQPNAQNFERQIDRKILVNETESTYFERGERVGKEQHRNFLMDDRGDGI